MPVSRRALPVAQAVPGANERPKARSASSCQSNCKRRSWVAGADSIDDAGPNGADIPAGAVAVNPGWQAKTNKNASPTPPMMSAHAKPIRQRIETSLPDFSKLSYRRNEKFGRKVG